MAERLKDKIAIVTGAGTSGPGMGNGKAAGRQYAAERIRCNAILLGMMDTPHIRTYYGDRSQEEVEQVMRVRDSYCPMGHMGDAWDAAHAALFLASEEARYIAGVLLVVDGGLTL